MKRTLSIVFATVAILIGVFIIVTQDADAASATETCVPSPGSPAIPGTPAVPAVPGTPEVPAVTQTIPGTPDLWWNWSPNDTKGPQDYEPGFPVDARGTWQGPHANGGPQQDTYGTFNASNGNSGNSSWFHREKGTEDQVIVITPAIPATPGAPEIPAVPETPAIPPVECPEAPVVEPCPDDSLILNPETGECDPTEPEVPTVPETPEEPPTTPETPEQPPVTPEQPPATPQTPPTGEKPSVSTPEQHKSAPQVPTAVAAGL